jgi:glutamate racemase
MDNNQPIGILTQGGTSIWKEIHHLLPMKTIYLADRMPYGQKSKEEIVALASKILICYLK